ncbi:efflux RND transporter permease subunit [Magnetococcus sp. PR-3]|uniref:efflux RND transporter permease subunit n=1 Tax=Magnetococcus sp. PR-3 TaxID=3120355 RepID=UPI002FCDEAE3
MNQSQPDQEHGLLHRFVTLLVENQHFTLMIGLVVVVFGVLSFFNVRVAQDPEVDIPILEAHFILAGASPSEIQQNVVQPIEKTFRSLTDIRKITTHISYNRAKVNLEFKFGVDLSERRQEVDSLISNIRTTLPSKLEYFLQKVRFSDLLVPFLVGVSSDTESQDELTHWSRQVAKQLRHIADLNHVKVIQAEQNIVIAVDPVKMRNLGVTTEDVRAAVRADNAYQPSGELRISEKSYRFMGPARSYQNVEDFYKTHVVTASGQVVSLGDFAVISKQPKNQDFRAKTDAALTVFVRAGANPDSNMLVLKNQVESVLKQVQSTLPPSIDVALIFDQSQEVGRTISNLLGNILQGTVILIGVLLFAVGIRSTLIIGSVVPLSLLAALMLLSFTPYGIQQVSIAGFIIALGLIVDNGIVVTENAYILTTYHGYSDKNAAIAGTSSAISPLFSSTLTTMLAFSPVFLLDSYVSVYLRSLSVTIWLCLFASLFVAVTITTLMLGTLGTRSTLLGIPSPPSFLNMLIPFRDRVYRSLIRFALGWRWLVLPLFMGLLFYSLQLSTTLPFKLFPHSGDPYLSINITMSPGSTVDDREALAQQIEQRLDRFEEIESFAAMLGAQFPWVSLGLDAAGDSVYLVKTSLHEEGALIDLKDRLRASFADLSLFGKINLSLFDVASAGKKKSTFTLEIHGDNYEELAEYGRRIDPIIKSHSDVTFMVNPAKPLHEMLQTLFLEKQAWSLGIGKPDVEALSTMLTYGWEIDRFRTVNNDEYPIVLKVEAPKEDPWRVLDGLELINKKGDAVPANEVLALRFAQSQGDIRHLNTHPIVEIDIWLKEGADAAAFSKDLLKHVVQKAPPSKGITPQLGGALKESQEDFQGLGQKIGLVVALIFSVFVFLFRSFSLPFVVLSAIPFCIMGSLFALFYSGESLSFIAALGMTSLMGIVVNDSILLVEESSRIRRHQPSMPLAQVAEEGACKRFMPVLLTSVTTIAGMIPLAMGTSMFKSMAIVIIGGLMSSTFLILFLVPVLFVMFSRTTAVPEGVEPLSATGMDRGTEDKSK